MSLGDLFKFVSPAEQKRRDLEFQKRVFPLGPGQKDLALNALRPLINPKIRNEELLFTFISAKQKYIDYSEAEAYAYIKKQKQFSETEKAYMTALVLLDACVESPGEYPSAPEIEQKSQTLCL